MAPWVSVVDIVGIAILGTLVTNALRGRPTAPRRHLFEDSDGERANPFADITAGAEAADESCERCGGQLDVPSYRFCGSCETPVVADD